MSKTEELYRFYLVLAEGGDEFYTEQICKIHLTNDFRLSKWWISSTYF